MEVFDRTFTITIVLRILATSVAFVGVLSAFMILQLERAREVAVLRALGMTRGQVWGVVSTQTGLMGLITGVAGHSARSCHGIDVDRCHQSTFVRLEHRLSRRPGYRRANPTAGFDRRHGRGSVSGLQDDGYGAGASP